MLVGLTKIAERRVEEEGKGKGKGKGGGSVVALGEYISFRVSNVHFQFRHSKIQSNGSFKLPVPSPRAIIMTGPSRFYMHASLRILFVSTEGHLYLGGISKTVELLMYRIDHSDPRHPDMLLYINII